MFLILVIGHTGQGKTTWVNNFIKDKRHYVFDLNNEYTHLPDDSEFKPKMRNVSLDSKRFLEVASGLENFNIVFEDATGFLRGRQSPAIIKQIVKKRHSKNNFLILFHSINRIPPELLEMANYVVLFKTNDNLEAIDNKFHNDEINKAFAEVKKLPKFKPVIIQLI